uniref:Membralin-like n=1 Tax=Phallusia mammillata TaxID=59560 RepID=A0A6F9D7F4_9ASCI|nr:membralin-like [Phallusia mammillata]
MDVQNDALNDEGTDEETSSATTARTQPEQPTESKSPKKLCNQKKNKSTPSSSQQSEPRDSSQTIHATNNNSNQPQQTSSAENATPSTPPPRNQNAPNNRNILQGHGRTNLTLYNREGFFMHYLFINLSVRYSSYFKSTSRRLLEFFALVNALAMLSVLVYIHVTFVRSTSDCLTHVKDIWPKSGILRVQVSNNASLPLYKMYFMEEPFQSTLSVEATPYDAVIKYTTPLTYNDVVRFKHGVETLKQPGAFSTKLDTCTNNENVRFLYAFGLLKNKCPVLRENYINDIKQSFLDKLFTVIPDISVSNRKRMNTISMVNEELMYYENVEARYDPFEPNPIRDFYAVEYSEEFGYLRLSTEARNKLAIPTLVVNLNPGRDVCFAGKFKQFMLSTFLGYDDYIMTSIKKLAEEDSSQGYLHNLVTGEYFRFVTMWINHASSIIALCAMIVFTLVVTMLLRYSYHQIFMFMVDLLRLLDTDTRLVFPAAPMLTIILALVGMEEIMTEFFHDSTVAFYVILLIWGADQFDVICLHTVISRRHWIRFFFLYHFAFYIYHYRFNGQYSKLALFTSWLFIQHSMLYFLHHYELPAIQSQMVLIQERNAERSRNRNNPDTGPDNNPNQNASANSEAPGTSQEPSNLPSPFDANAFPDAEGDVAPTAELYRPLFPEATLFYQKLLRAPQKILSKLVSLFCIYKSDVCKICMLVLVCVVMAAFSALFIHSNLTHTAKFHMERMENLV